MYSQFKKGRSPPDGELVGYATRFDGSYCLIVDASQIGGWPYLGPDDVVFKECKSYWYVSVSDLKTEDYD